MVRRRDPRGSATWPRRAALGTGRFAARAKPPTCAAGDPALPWIRVGDDRGTPATTWVTSSRWALASSSAFTTVSGGVDEECSSSGSGSGQLAALGPTGSLRLARRVGFDGSMSTRSISASKDSRPCPREVTVAVAPSPAQSSPRCGRARAGHAASTDGCGRLEAAEPGILQIMTSSNVSISYGHRPLLRPVRCHLMGRAWSAGSRLRSGLTCFLRQPDLPGSWRVSPYARGSRCTAGCARYLAFQGGLLCLQIRRPRHAEGKGSCCDPRPLDDCASRPQLDQLERWPCQSRAPELPRVEPSACGRLEDCLCLSAGCRSRCRRREPSG